MDEAERHRRRTLAERVMPPSFQLAAAGYFTGDERDILLQAVGTLVQHVQSSAQQFTAALWDAVEYVSDQQDDDESMTLGTFITTADGTPSIDLEGMWAAYPQLAGEAVHIAVASLVWRAPAAYEDFRDAVLNAYVRREHSDREDG